MVVPSAQAVVQVYAEGEMIVAVRPVLSLVKASRLHVGAMAQGLAPDAMAHLPDVSLHSRDTVPDNRPCCVSHWKAWVV